jgi:hypothetical protein
LKHYSAPRESLESWERLFLLKGLKETPGIDQYPGFGTTKIFKARVVPLGENVGKSKGYRLILEMINEQECKIIVFLRHGVYKSEQELRAVIKSRIG